MKIEGRINILGSEDGVSIEIFDHKAVIKLCEIVLSAEEFCAAALGRMSRLECEVEVPAPELIGKERESKVVSFVLPEQSVWKEKYGTYDRCEVAKHTGFVMCPKGWTPDLYFNSRDSFTVEGAKITAHMNIYKWHSKEKE